MEVHSSELRHWKLNKCCSLQLDWVFLCKMDMKKTRHQFLQGKILDIEALVLFDILLQD